MDEITIGIPVYKRHEFLGLTAHNIKSQTYPHHKLTVIIDECRSNEPFIRDISQLRQFLHPIKLIHNIYNKRATIGEKRNRSNSWIQMIYIVKIVFYIIMDYLKKIDVDALVLIK